jgi:hypothetical protein
MGFNTVVVIYNDHTGMSYRSLERMDRAILNWPGHRDSIDLNFGYGQVISQDHADGEQVVIVSRNSGKRATDAEQGDLGWQALMQMQHCLMRHGYKVTKPKKAKAASVSLEQA